MKYRLRTKLSVSYVLVILVCVTLITLLANRVLDRQFSAYVAAQQQKQAQDTVAQLSQSYASSGVWNKSALEEIGTAARENGLIVKVNDTDDALVWDTSAHHNGRCQQMLTAMHSNMQSRYGNWQGGYKEDAYPITYGGQTVGTAHIGYYGPFFYTDSDLSFISTINTLIVWAGVFSAALALAVGVLMSRQISNPIARVVAKAQHIADGSYGETIVDKSRTLEIRRLVDTVNKLADTLQKQEERSTQASSDIAHELRTPLATMQGNLEAVMDGVMELTPGRIRVLHEEVLRITRLVESLSALARYERRESALQKTSFDLATLIAETVTAVQADFETEGKRLTFEGQSQTVFADRDQLHQVMGNLLSNALKYTRRGDQVTVTLQGEAEQVRITVRDTGIGISAADLPYIFERFFRADPSRSRKTGGAGIGLTIVKSILTAHGGTITAHSQPEVGTEFTVTLPRGV